MPKKLVVISLVSLSDKVGSSAAPLPMYAGGTAVSLCFLAVLILFLEVRKPSLGHSACTTLAPVRTGIGPIGVGIPMIGHVSGHCAKTELPERVHGHCYFFRYPGFVVATVARLPGTCSSAVPVRPSMFPSPAPLALGVLA